MRPLPSIELQTLPRPWDALIVESIVKHWLAKPHELCQLNLSERHLLRNAASLAFRQDLADSIKVELYSYHARRQISIASKAEAEAIVAELSKDTVRLGNMSFEEWVGFLEIIKDTGIPGLYHKLDLMRDEARSEHPEVQAAIETLEQHLGNDRILLSARGRRWSQLLSLADFVPTRISGAYNNYRARLSEAKTKAVMRDRVDKIPRSAIKHVGVVGTFTLPFVRNVEERIAKKWVTVPRIKIGWNRKSMTFKEGKPDADTYDCDYPLGPFYGIPPDARLQNTTSIICPAESAVTLILFEMTVFDANVSTELEAYFRTLGPFPWEQKAADWEAC